MSMAWLDRQSALTESSVFYYIQTEVATRNYLKPQQTVTIQFVSTKIYSLQAKIYMFLSSWMKRM
jgi:hypothetical protein